MEKYNSAKEIFKSIEYKEDLIGDNSSEELSGIEEIESMKQSVARGIPQGTFDNPSTFWVEFNKMKKFDQNLNEFWENPNAQNKLDAENAPDGVHKQTNTILSIRIRKLESDLKYEKEK